MPDWDYICGFGDEGGDPDHDIHDPAGHCGNYTTARTVYGGYRMPRRERNRTACKECGSTDVHWREVAQGWRLFDNQRQHPGNRYIEHTCAHTTPNTDGFEDVPE